MFEKAHFNSSAGRMAGAFLITSLSTTALAIAQQWVPIPGQSPQVSIAPDGTAVCVDNADNIYFRTTKGTWAKQPGLLHQISAGSATQIWGVTKTNDIFRWSGTSWVLIPGSLKQVSAAFDGTVWGTDSNDRIFSYDATKNGWVQLPGFLRQVSVTSHWTAWGVNAASNVYRWNGTTWEGVPGGLSDISVGQDGEVWGVNGAGQVWRYLSNGNWQLEPGNMAHVSVANAAKVWATDRLGQIWQFQPSLSTLLGNAYSVSACPPAAKRILQDMCDGPVVNPDLQQFEGDTVATWLDVHHLPASDRSIIYQFGRFDLRTEIRSMMLTTLIAIAYKPVANRTPHEQALYGWLAAKVKAQEVALYQAAVNDSNAWQNDPCHWRPDPQIAAVVGLSYDSGPFCAAKNLYGLAGTVFPPVPTVNYFTSAAMQKTYGQPISQTPGGASAALITMENLAEIDGYAALGGAAAGGVAYGLVFTFLEDIAPFALRTSFQFALGAADAAEAAAEAAVVAADAGVEAAAAAAELGATAAAEVGAGFATGPLVVILLAVESAVNEFMTAIDYQTNVDALKGLPASLAAVQAGAPDLAAFASDATGLHKLTLAFTAATLPDFSSTQPLPSHRDGTDPVFLVQSGSQTNVTPTFKYKDYYGSTWTITPYGGWFAQTGTLSDGSQATSITPTLHIVDWKGVKRQATALGNQFLVTMKTPGPDNKPCPVSGLAADYSQCSSYVTQSLNLKDAAGNNVTLSIGTAPVFTMPDGVVFNVNQLSTFPITATGSPAPVIQLVQGTLPTGLSYPYLFQNQIGGFPLLGTDGTYQVTFRASNGMASATKTVTVYIGSSALGFKSPAQATFAGGRQQSFQVRVAGFPVPSLSIDQLPGGLTFTDNHDGTATISGSYNGYPYACAQSQGGPCMSSTITARNVQQTITQNIVLTLQPAPLPHFTSSNAVTFVVGQMNSFRVTTTGATTPIQLIVTDNFPLFASNISPHLPSWMSLTNINQGTVELRGVPPADSSPQLPLYLYVYAAGTGVVPGLLSINGSPVVLPDSQTLTIAMIQSPAFFTAPSAQFKVGTAGNFQAQTAVVGGTYSFTGPLPQGVTASVTGNGITFSGTPVTGSGGAYPLTLSNQTPSGLLNFTLFPTWTTSQNFTLFVAEPPAVTGGSGFQNLIFEAGASMAAKITPSGYPSPMATLPAGAPGKPMTIQLTGGQLPPGLSLVTTNSSGTPLGYALIKGSPLTAAINSQYPITLTIDNGLGTQTLNWGVSVYQLGDVTRDGKVDCSDFKAVKALLGAKFGDGNYSQGLDLNGDLIIDAIDLAIIGRLTPGCS